MNNYRRALLFYQKQRYLTSVFIHLKGIDHYTYYNAKSRSQEEMSVYLNYVVGAILI
jgi:hypothetical protein